MYIITNADHKKYIDDLIPAKKLKEMEKLQYSVKIVNEKCYFLRQPENCFKNVKLNNNDFTVDITGRPPVLLKRNMSVTYI